jgi:flagellar P-ring protein precursor FlgI
MRRAFAAALLAVLFLVPLAAPQPVAAQDVRLKDITHVQGVTGNHLVGYGIVTGLTGTGDSTTQVFTSQTVQNVLQAFGVNTAITNIRTRNVAAVIVTATLPPFAHSGDNIDVIVSSMGDASTLQGGTLALTELRGANNLVYATAQGPVSVGGFSLDTPGGSAGGQNSLSKNFVTAGRVPQGGIIARDMLTNIQQDATGFSYVLTSPDYATASRVASVLNARFGRGTAHALDAETVRVTLPSRYANDPVSFLADASDLRLNADQTAKVVINERTGTIVFGGDITLSPVAIAHGNLTLTITTQNRVVQPGPLTNAQGRLQTNTQIAASETGRKLIYINGAPSLAQVVRALNTIGVSPRDLISIVQALRESGSLQADLEII